MPSDTLDPENPAAPEEYLAVTILDRVTQDVLLDDVKFNRRTQLPDNMSDVIAVYNRLPGKEITLFKDELIERNTGDVLTNYVGHIEVVLTYAFEECPYHVQNYIVTKAIRKLQDSLSPDTLLYQITKQDELEARYKMLELEAKTERYNLIEDVRERLGRRIYARAYGAEQRQQETNE